MSIFNIRQRLRYIVVAAAVFALSTSVAFGQIEPKGDRIFANVAEQKLSTRISKEPSSISITLSLLITLMRIYIF